MIIYSTRQKSVTDILFALCSIFQFSCINLVLQICHFRNCWMKCSATIFWSYRFCLPQGKFFLEFFFFNRLTCKKCCCLVQVEWTFSFYSFLCVQLEAMAILISGCFGSLFPWWSLTWKSLLKFVLIICLGIDWS